MYAGGKLIIDSIYSEYERTKEHRYAELALKRAKEENANRVKNEIINKCNNAANVIKQNMSDKELNYITVGVLQELDDICSGYKTEDINLLESININNQKKLDRIIAKYTEQITIAKRNFQDNQNAMDYIKKVENIFKSLKVIDYSDIENIVFYDEQEQFLANTINRIDVLTQKFYRIVNREIDRCENIPLNETMIIALSEKFNTISNQIRQINTIVSEGGDLRKKSIDKEIGILEENINAYNIYKQVLDKEYSKFMHLYLKYKKSCEALNEEYKESVEFDSFEMLEEAVRERKARLEKMEKCARIYEKMGKDAYICMAFDTELKRLNYASSSEEETRLLLNQSLEHCKVGNNKTPFYQYKDSATKLFNVNENVALQLIIHSDGSSTMETIAVGNPDEDLVKKTQKKHCDISKELISNLRNNWFIDLDLEETKSPDDISYSFEKQKQKDGIKSNKKLDDRFIRQSGKGVSDKQRVEIARQQRIKINTEKRKKRSAALHF